MRVNKENAVLKWQKAIVVVLRVILGAVFVVSGTAKAIDPWGTVFKVSEYLDVVDLVQPRTLIVLASLILSWGEFLLGALLLLGCYRRVVVWLMSALMAFMLPLSLWILVSDPVADCGCFGDAIILSNSATFIKNVLIVGALIPLWMWNNKVQGLFTPYSQWLIGAFLTLFIGIVSLTGYNIQPLIDFRRFPVGTELTNDSTDDDTDGVIYRFVYEKEGETQEFDEDNLPDSTWTFVDRKVVSGREGASDSFVILADGEDVTSDVISPSGEQLIVVVNDMMRVNPSHTFAINELSRQLAQHEVDIVTLIAGDEKGLDYWQDISMTRDPVYTAEPTLLKELVRGNVAFVWLANGKILWKRTMSSVDIEHFNDEFESYEAYPGRRFGFLVVGTILILLVIYIADRTGLLLWLHIKRRRLLKKNEPADADKSTENG